MTERTSDPGIDVDLTGASGDVVSAVWAQALGLDTVDPEAGFFDLGASSAMVVGVVRALRRRWPRIKIVDVFAHPTAACLAAFLDDV